MNKDNLLYALAGLFLGFVSSYLMFEAMAVRQPARRLAGAAVEPSGAMPGGEAAQAPPGGEAGVASMEQVQRLRDHVAANPDDAPAVLQLAGLNFQIQNWARARDLYTQYLKLRPDQPDVLSDLGVTYHELGEPKEALRLFDRAQEVQPDHWQSRFNEVIVLALDLQDYAAAEAVIAELKRLQPDNQDVVQLEAEVQRRKAA